jgi:hypothetical protein
MGLLNKIAYGFCRIYFYIKEIPFRIFRLLKQFVGLGKILFDSDLRKWKNILQWNIELFFLFFDIIAIPDIYEFVIDVFKNHSRPLNEIEKAEAVKVFRDAINLDRIRVDDRARIGARKHKYAYVSFYTINLHGMLRPNLLIHELVHVWQYSQYGSVYIPRALQAQRSELKYNYGGLESLLNGIKGGLDLSSYNYEQQADIVTDYYKLMNGERVQWGSANSQDIKTYQYYVDSIVGKDKGNKATDSIE